LFEETLVYTVVERILFADNFEVALRGRKQISQLVLRIRILSSNIQIQNLLGKHRRIKLKNRLPIIFILGLSCNELIAVHQPFLFLMHNMLDIDLFLTKSTIDEKIEKILRVSHSYCVACV
jgi:hypothetical protein